MKLFPDPIEKPRPVPVRALVLSIGALSVPMVGAILFPQWAGEEVGVLLWLTALVPAFLLTYYRGWWGASLGLALGMAALSLTQVVLVSWDLGTPNWSVLLGVVMAYVGICFGVGWVADMLNNERRKAESMALTDVLTGLPNRRHATIFLDAAFAAAARGTPLTVVLFDLDRFKDYNDEYGHQAGDEALRVFGGILAAISRRMNLAARYGGEEFVGVLSACDTAGAVIFADRVCGRLRNAGLSRVMTTSVGIASYEKGMGTPDLLVAAADRALYAAKHAGRDAIFTLEGGELRNVTPEVRSGGDASSEPGRAHPPRRDRPPPRPGLAEALQRKEDDTIPPAHAGECLLLVDDDDDSRAAVARLLRRLGYEVVEEEGGEQGLARFDRERARFAGVVADLVMPEMSGFTMAQQMERLEPGLRVLYMSGYLHHDVTWSGAPGAVSGFIQKPMMIGSLARKAREVLDASAETEVGSGPADAGERDRARSPQGAA